MNSVDLMFFAAVADAGGIGRAALALNTVQSNVTARVRALEQTLRVPLFYRGRRGVTLTKAGESLLPYARQVARLLADAEQAVLSVETPCGLLRLGAMETTAALRLPKLLSDFASLYPEVDIDLQAGPTEALIEQVLERKIEGAFVSGHISHADLASVQVLDEELVLVAASKIEAFDDVVARLSGRREARVIVFRLGCSYRLCLEGFLAEYGLVNVRRMEFGTLDGIIACIEAGMGVSLLPRIVVEAAKRDGRVSVHPIPGGTGSVRTSLVYRRDSLLTSAFERFMEHTHVTFGSLLKNAPISRPRPDHFLSLTK